MRVANLGQPPQCLADYMARLIRDRDLVIRFGQNSSDLVAPFTPRCSAQVLASIADGQFSDILSINHPTDGTKNTNDTIKADFKNNTWVSKDKQTLTITLPRGATCAVTNERVLTNAGPNGPLSQYFILKTEPQ